LLISKRPADGSLRFKTTEAITYGKPILKSVEPLKSLIANFQNMRSLRNTVRKVTQRGRSNRRYIKQIECARDNLQSLIYKMKAVVISEETELLYMLGTRITEAPSNKNRLARKLNYPRAQSAHEDPRTETAIA
ncbi:hypothetical protein COOONC_00250, partial [Cooperia oncophora]